MVSLISGLCSSWRTPLASGSAKAKPDSAVRQHGAKAARQGAPIVPLHRLPRLPRRPRPGRLPFLIQGLGSRASRRVSAFDRKAPGLVR